MQVRAKKAGEYPLGQWREADEEFEYTKPKGSKRGYFPLWLEQVKGSKATEEEVEEVEEVEEAEDGNNDDEE